MGISENDAVGYLEFHKKGLHTNGFNDKCVDKAIQALHNQEAIIRLLRCHDDFSREMPEKNYELVNGIRNILKID